MVVSNNVYPSVTLIFSFILVGHLTLFVDAMSWASTWETIIQGGPTFWKVDNLESKKRALTHILQYVSTTVTDKDPSRPLKILCPLAGDDPFVKYAWSQGHDVTAIDLVPAAVKLMRRQFGDADSDWTSQSMSDSTVWKHKSGRATLYVGDIMQRRRELNGVFDAVYDKDSFGALSFDLRQPFCERLAEYCKQNAILYTEVKIKEGGRESGGPPFHVEKEDLMESTSFGTTFEHVASLGELYPWGFAGAKQTGHILKRK